MNAHLRRTFYLFTLGFVTLVAVLAYWQVYAKEPLANDPANSLQSRRVQEVPRGLILAGDGETELARSVQGNDGTYSRVYPEGSLYAGVTGYWSTRYGASGLEMGENSNLSGAGEPETLDELINQVSGGPQAGNDVELTLDPELQRLAYDQLAQSSTGRGAVVALNPKNGEILALASYPSFDPNNIDDNFEELVEDPSFPLVNRATQGLYPPGSTFKVITAAAALEAGVKPSDRYRDTGTYETPGYSVYNYRARVYGQQDFQGALTYSINTIFARIANESVGAQNLARTAEDFGFGDAYKDFPLPISPSVLGPPPEQWDQGNIAQISFGQQTVQSNVFEMGLVAGAIANGGTMMEPRLVREVRSPDGAVLDRPTSRVHSRAMDGESAQTLNDMMQRAITDYETGAEIPGVKVAGKTGTAEAPNDELHSWFISFAPADDPEIAIAVLVENGQEGYKSALPIARRLMEAHLRSTGTLSQESQRSNQPAGQQNETTQPAGPPNQTSGQPPGQAPNQAPFQFPFQNPFQPPAQGPNQVPGKAQPPG
ncbi:MAG: penicillin-binding transpeptidase domain-containing protein [Actinomycetota bacterium]|nr:penicillin-binding transpeptidase domain-containing protein [Actinomycetota bacterium]